ncbi:MAG: FAD:protein FMN transferase [Chloroflexota bacterium]|nr:FAD:protein FMN transferase [Chloroflexota bacterium]
MTQPRGSAPARAVHEGSMLAQSTALPKAHTIHTFFAMGCRVEVQIVHDAQADVAAVVEEAIAAIVSLFALYEAELSRFLPQSGLSRLNRAAGTGAVHVTPLLCAITADALIAAAATDGLFDPTLGTVLAHLGYDRPFPFPTLRDDGAIPALLPQHRPDGWREIIVDQRAETMTLPTGIALDFGGIGKGWTVDRAAEHLREIPGVHGGLVNAGGDLRVWGAAPDEDPAWTVGVEAPDDRARDCAILAVNDRAVATSSTAYRRWRRGERWIHHVLDPRTGQPATTNLVSVTVIGPSAAWAEIHAKVALISGIEAGIAYLTRQCGYTGLCITTDGTQRGTAGMKAYQQ